MQYYFVEKQPITHTLIENLSFLRAQKGLKFEFAIEAITIFIKSIKKALGGMFTLLVSQQYELSYIYCKCYFHNMFPSQQPIIQTFTSYTSPTLFNNFINDAPSSISNNLKLYAHNLTLLRPAFSCEDQNLLQNNLGMFCQQAEDWLLKFNVVKCHAIHFGKQNPCCSNFHSGHPK